MFLERLIKFFASLRLTVVLLALGIILVFTGTLAQVNVGLYQAQSAFFRSFFVTWQPEGSHLRIPVFPGGYLVGSLLVLNLTVAHFTRFRFSWRKSGIWLVHIGLVVLLLGQLSTDMLSKESAMHLGVGETRNYSEDFRANELVVIDTTDPQSDQVFSFSEAAVARQGELTHPDLPFKLRVKGYWPNCDLFVRPPAEARSSGATQGSLAGELVVPLPDSADPSQTRAAVLLEVVGDSGPAGTWLIATGGDGETIHVGKRHWEASLQFAPMMGGHFLMWSDPARSEAEQPAPIGEAELKPGHEITLAGVPFKLRVREFWPRCRLFHQPAPTSVIPEITAGEYGGLVIEPRPKVTVTDLRDMPAAVVEFVSPKGSVGTWLLPAAGPAKQGFELDGRTYEIAMRFERHYKPFSITLLDASHKKYRGTSVARDFRSRVRVRREDTGEIRETEIYMNAPLRFAGYTFFQYQMSADESRLRPGEKPSSTFEVVRNPGWLTPYISCIMVAIGLGVQFMVHLVGFISKWRPA